ncbi:MAG TPA: class II aldolase/adducin family protein [Anaerolineales bacterium]|jgi:L-fuculose-phosphate aldolase|nr:class II aldolase/adducin family protein [Anaerolineales bacterium]
MDSVEAREQLRTAGRYMLENDLAWGNAGNISARIGGDHYLITASGTRLGDLKDDDLVECSLDGSFSGDHKPSKETPMHRAIYEQRPEIGAILHASPFYSTLVACADIRVPADLFIEDMYYLERVEHVSYFHAGSRELGEAVRLNARRANILLLDNHGVLVYDTSIQEALMAMHTLEFVCRMAITARGAGIELRSLPVSTVHDFLENSGYRPRREWPQ